jgi:O-antigen/teichoic acid export membrane protein
MSIYKRIISGSIASYFGIGITIFFQLISVPLFLESWGKDIYSEWILIYSIPFAISLLELGFFSILSNEISKLLTRNESDLASNLIGYSFNKVFIFSSFTFVFIFLFIYLVIDIELLITLYVSLLSILLFLFNYNIALYRSIRLFHLGNWFSIVARLIESVGVIVSVFYGAGITQVLLVFVSVRLITLIFSSLVLIKKMKRKNIFWSSKLYNGKVLLVNTGKYALFPLSILINNQVLIYVVGWLLNPASLIILTTSRTIFRIQNQCVRAFTSSTWQEFNFLFNTGKNHEALALFYKVIGGTILFLFMSSFILVHVGFEYYIQWTKGMVDVSRANFFLLGGSVAINALWQPIHTYLASQNKFSLHVTSIFILNVVMIISVLLFASDINDIAKALMILESLCCFICMYSFFKIKGQTYNV